MLCSCGWEWKPMECWAYVLSFELLNNVDSIPWLEAGYEQTKHFMCKAIQMKIVAKLFCKKGKSWLFFVTYGYCACILYEIIMK